MEKVATPKAPNPSGEVPPAKDSGAGRNPDVPPTSKKVSPWVKAFVFFHIIAITIWATPNPPQAYMSGTPWTLRTDGISNFAQSLNDGYRVFNRFVLKDSPVKFYDLGTGFWQYWDMFAPNPADTDFYGDSIVTFKDGSTKIYEYPRMYKLDLVSRYTKERYRKFYERAHTDEFQYMWPQFAQYIALLNYKDPNNPPISVELRNHWRPVQPPGKDQLQEYYSGTYFRYRVDQDQLLYSAKSMFVLPYDPHAAFDLSNSDHSSGAPSK